MSDALNPVSIAEILRERGGARGSGDIARQLEAMIRLGELEAGARLPTVRRLAKALDVNPSTVSAAWVGLQGRGMIETHRRGGSFVTGLGASSKRAEADEDRAWAAFDLARNFADPLLLPSLDRALAFGLGALDLHLPHREAITGRLMQAVAVSWPFEPGLWATAAGGAEAAFLAVEAATDPGGVVAIESPTSPRLLRVLQDLGQRIIPVACDDEGPLAQELERALGLGATTFVYQPRAQVPLGHDVSLSRISELAQVLARSGPRVRVVEDDNSGPLAAGAPRSIGSHLPDRVIHVRSYCRAYGSDLKTAVIAGEASLVRRSLELRSQGRGATSRILQDALAFLIRDPATGRRLAAAKRRYASRQRALAQAISALGVPVRHRAGPTLWMPVRDETAALIRLSARGITVGVGHKCFPDPAGQPQMLRIATSRIPDDTSRLGQLARLLVDASLDTEVGVHD